MDGLRACVSIVFFPYIIIVMNKYYLTPTTMYFLRDTAKKKKGTSMFLYTHDGFIQWICFIYLFLYTFFIFYI